MNILLLGATGATGKILLKQALLAGHKLTVLVRHPEKLNVDPTQVTVIIGDATNKELLRQAIKGNEIVISTLGGTNTSLLTNATKAILAAAEGGESIERIIMMSSFAARQSQLSKPAKILTKVAIKKIIADKNRAEELLRAGGIGWTVVYATTLNNKTELIAPRVMSQKEKIRLRDTIARTNVSHWILNELDTKAYLNNDVVITQ